MALWIFPHQILVASSSWILHPFLASHDPVSRQVSSNSSTALPPSNTPAVPSYFYIFFLNFYPESFRPLSSLCQTHGSSFTPSFPLLFFLCSFLISFPQKLPLSLVSFPPSIPSNTSHHFCTYNLLPSFTPLTLITQLHPPISLIPPAPIIIHLQSDPNIQSPFISPTHYPPAPITRPALLVWPPA